MRTAREEQTRAKDAHEIALKSCVSETDALRAELARERESLEKVRIDVYVYMFMCVCMYVCMYVRVYDL